MYFENFLNNFFGHLLMKKHTKIVNIYRKLEDEDVIEQFCDLINIQRKISTQIMH